MFALFIETVIVAYFLGAFFFSTFFVIITSIHISINSKKYTERYSKRYKTLVMGKPKTGFEYVETMYQKAINILYKISVIVGIISAIILFIQNFKTK